MNRHAFVTGGTGFIGINLIRLLIDEGWAVTALCRETSVRTPLQDLPFNWVIGSLTDPASLRGIIPDDADTVFHLAGDTNMWKKRNAQQTAVNVDGTSLLVNEAARAGIKVFIHTSSIAAWGKVSGRVTEKRTQQGGVSWINYEQTKWLGERKALEGEAKGMKVLILNPGNVIGAYDRTNWGRLFTALRDDTLPVIADGCVSIANVREVAHAHLAAAERGTSGERYILGGDHRMFSDFVRCIDRTMGAGNMPRVVPTALFRAYAYIASGKAAVLKREPDLTPELAYLMTRKDVKYVSAKAKKELGYRIPPMQQSVQECYDWLRNAGVL